MGVREGQSAKGSWGARQGKGGRKGALGMTSANRIPEEWFGRGYLLLKDQPILAGDSLLHSRPISSAVQQGGLPPA